MAGNKTRLIASGVIAGLALLAIVALVLVVSGRQGEAGVADIAACQELRQSDARPLINCVSAAVNSRLKQDPNPSRVLPAVDRQVAKLGDEAKANCHVAMHLVGSRFAKEKQVTLTNMQRYLPASDSTNCSAGFTHGMISVMGVNPVKARQMAQSICSKEPSRARQFACVHGIGHGLRRYMGDPKQALKLCRELRSKSAASDCGQGVYHDFFLAAPAIQQTEKLNQPQGDSEVKIADLVGPVEARGRSNELDRLCLDQPRDFLRECWYRLASGPGVPVPVETAQDITFACGGLSGEQKRGCVAGIAATRIPPERLVKVCSRLPRQDQVGQCIDGINLISVGWDPAGGKSHLKYHREDIPKIVADCATYISNPQVQRSCIRRVAQFSFRSVPAKTDLKGAETACRKLSGALREVCRDEVAKSYQESFRIKV